MNTSADKTQADLKAAAFEAGRILGQATGDFYDLVEELARGYASVNNGPEHALRKQLIALSALGSASATVLEWRVDDAREQHMPWSAIGEVLDMSKQAAQQKYGSK